jgi:hypothetical protein
MKNNWGHDDIVDSPGDAGLIFEIGFSAPITDEGQSAVSHGPRFDLVILDGKTHVG